MSNESRANYRLGYLFDSESPVKAMSANTMPTPLAGGNSGLDSAAKP